MQIYQEKVRAEELFESILEKDHREMETLVKVFKAAMSAAERREELLATLVEVEAGRLRQLQEQLAMWSSLGFIIPVC